MPEKLYFDGMHGIGDNINQRCFVKALVDQGHEIWLKTPLPEIYYGIRNLHFVHANSPLRTQQKSENLSQASFEKEPPGLPRRRIFYGINHLEKGSVFDAMEEQFGIAPAYLDLPGYRPANIHFPEDKPLALIRPTTERSEWHNATRGPLNQYIDEVSRQLAVRGFHVVSVADIQDEQEWIPDLEPFAHQKFHHGELTIWQMLALVERADIVLTGPCVIMHAALAYGRPMICLGGGNGGNNHHSKVTDSRCMDLSRSLFIYPDNYCECQQMQHDCDKTITGLSRKTQPFIDEVYAGFSGDGMDAFSDELKNGLVWLPELGMGRFPVPKLRPYNEQYFVRYQLLAKTELGKKLTESRMQLVARHYDGPLVDVGIGAGQFVSSRPNTRGYDVNLEGIRWLRSRGQWADLYSQSYTALSFWDSLEHIDLPDRAIARAEKWVFVSVPIFDSAEHVIHSRHYRKDEHIWYWTHIGLVNWFARNGFELVEHNKIESVLGRDGIGSYAFRRKK